MRERKKKNNASQAGIAALAGVDRTTVNKILNHYAGDRSSSETVEKVLRAARKLGYDFTRLDRKRNPNRRRETRKKVNLNVDVAIHLEDGTLFDTGRGRILDVSRSGALLADLETQKRNLPLAPFYCRLTLRDASHHEGVSIPGKFLRFFGNGTIQFGIRFEALAETERNRLMQLLSLES
jgi:transcriptional regulator with XRE-family HTH domain